MTESDVSNAEIIRRLSRIETALDNFPTIMAVTYLPRELHIAQHEKQELQMHDIKDDVEILFKRHAATEKRLSTWVRIAVVSLILPIVVTIVGYLFYTSLQSH